MSPAGQGAAQPPGTIVACTQCGAAADAAFGACPRCGAPLPLAAPIAFPPGPPPAVFPGAAFPGQPAAMPGPPSTAEGLRAYNRKKGLEFMAGGAALFLVGAFITFGSINAARPGGLYWVAWGPMLFGGILFLAGLVRHQS